jgi:hypothetical protein
MKKITAIALIAFFAITKDGFGQTGNAMAFNSSKLSKTAIKGVIKINSKFINVNAKRDFVQTFRNITNEVWFSIPGGYIANFLLNGIDYRIAYNNKGKWQYNQLIYSEEKLPFKVRDLVKSQYYDFDIEYCSEYQVRNLSVYIIALKDLQSMKISKVKVVEGEMELLPDNKKE